MPGRIIAGAIRGGLRYLGKGAGATRNLPGRSAAGARRAVPGGVGAAAGAGAGALAGSAGRTAIIGAASGAGGYFAAQGLGGASDAARSVRTTARKTTKAIVPAAVAVGAVVASQKVSDRNLQLGLYGVAGVAGFAALKGWQDG